MKTIAPALIGPTLWMAACLSGCATAHQLAAPLTLRRSGLIADPQQAARLERAMTDRDIADLLDVDVKAKLPTAIAVAHLESQCSGYQPRLRDISAEQLDAWGEALRCLPHVTGAMPVSPLVHPREDVSLHSLRVAAARMNCELLLVCLESTATVDNYNDAAALYWTLVGLWLVPGNVYEHRTVIQAVLVDSRTGMVLGAASGDCHLKRAYAAAFRDIPRDTFRRQAPERALADLRKGAGGLVRSAVTAALAQKGK